MPAPALSDLLTTLTPSQVNSQQLAFLGLAGMPTTSWQSGSVPLTLVQSEAQTISSLSNTIAQIAAGGLLSTAIGPWLDLIALSNYGLTRKPAIPTQLYATLTDTGGGPFVITAGQLFATSTTGVIFTNISAGTLPKNGTLQLTWQATAAGIAGNIANGALTTLTSGLPGVSISNPAVFGTTTSILQLGSDAESDASLATRCMAQWPGLGGGATKLVYQGWALAAPGTSVTRAQVAEAYPTGGSVTVYVAGQLATAPSGDVAVVQNYINSKRPLCVTVIVSAASAVQITISGNVFVTSSLSVQAQQSFQSAIIAFGSSLPIGPTTVYLSKLIDILQAIPGVRNVALTLPSSDTTLTQGQVVTNFVTSGLVWNPV